MNVFPGGLFEVQPRDANVLRTSGFKSALLMPLVSRGRAVGTLNVVSRTIHATVRARSMTTWSCAAAYSLITAKAPYGKARRGATRSPPAGSPRIMCSAR